MEPSYSTTGKLSNHQSTLPPQASHRGVTAESRPSGKQRDEREAVEPPVHAATRQPSHASHPPQQRDAESRPSGKPSHHQSTPPHRPACGRGGWVGWDYFFGGVVYRPVRAAACRMGVRSKGPVGSSLGLPRQGISLAALRHTERA